MVWTALRTISEPAGGGTHSKVPTLGGAFQDFLGGHHACHLGPAAAAWAVSCMASAVAHEASRRRADCEYLSMACEDHLTVWA